MTLINDLQMGITMPICKFKIIQSLIPQHYYKIFFLST